MIVGSAHTAFPMGDVSRVGEARRHASQLARELGFDDTDCGRAALIATELATNLVRHARGGRLLLASRVERQELELVSVDEGPGIADTGKSLIDGFSTGGTPGTGLGAVRRLADRFDIYSHQPQGTVVVAQLAPGRAAVCAARDAIRGGAISIAAPGESVCGDGWAFAVDRQRASMVLADGLGHGPEAAIAAGEALRVFQQDPWLPPAEQLRRAHDRLRGTRGAAVLFLAADASEGRVRSAGAGNVLARLVSGTADRTILCQHGTAGLQIRTPEETITPWPDHAAIVVHSDGVASRWRPDLLREVLMLDPSIAAAVLLREHARGRDDATVAVLVRSQ